jgi:magnesium transporter
MKLKAFEINEQRLLEAIPFESLSPAWYEDSAHRWLDVEGADPEALRKLLAPLDLHPLVLEACAEPGVGSRFAAYEKELFIEFPVLEAVGDYQQTRISIICLPTVLLTIHYQPITGMPLLADDLSANRRLREATASGLLYELFDHVADQLSWRAAPARVRANEIATALDEDPESVEVGDILGLKRRFGELIDVLEDVLFCLARLQTAESKAFQTGELGIYLRDLASTLQNGHNAARRFEGRLSDLHQQYVMTQQDKMNSRLQTLTLISAVFLPLTLLAGIYGMNFAHMPELQWLYGYPGVLGFMVGIVVVMLYVFYRRGWFQ